MSLNICRRKADPRDQPPPTPTPSLIFLFFFVFAAWLVDHKNFGLTSDDFCEASTKVRNKDEIVEPNKTGASF